MLLRMCMNFVVVVGCALGCAPEATQQHPADPPRLPGAPTYSTPVVISASATSGIETEPSLARGTDGRVLIAYLTYPPPGDPSLPGVAAVWSLDDGASFAAPVRLDAAAADADLLGNAMVAIDGAGRGHIAVIASTLTPQGAYATSKTVVYSTAPNDEVFSQLSAPFQDVPRSFKPWLTTLNDGAVVVATALGNAGSTVLGAARLAPDSDAFVTLPVGAAGGGMVGEGHAFVCPRGDRGFILVGYALNPALNADGIYLSVTSRLSADGVNIGPATKVSLDTESVTDGAIMCGAKDDDIAISYGVGVIPSNTDQFQATTEHIAVVASHDGGVTFDDRSDAQAGGAPVAALPAMVINDNATLHVLYLGVDAINNAGSLFHRMRDLREAQESSAWSAPVEVAPILLNSNRLTPRYIGDYFYGAAVNFGVMFVYADNNGPSSHVAFVRIDR